MRFRDAEDGEAFGEEVSERLHVKPMALTLEIIKRLTHVRKNEIDATPITPPLEPCLLPCSVLTPSLGAYLLTQKFFYHSPFYREQWKLKASHGIELTRNLMCSWHDHLADTLHPLYKILGVKFRQTDYLKIDETPIRYLEPGNGKTATGYFWVYHHAEHGVLFDWHKSRKFKEARDDHPRITARILLIIGSIYQVEKRLREERAGPLQRQCTR